MSSEIPTIYHWAGGRPAFERWLGRFYDLVEDDELLARLFGGTVSDQHRRDVVTWWCEVMGGPATYTEDLGGYEHMLSKHRGLHITREQRLRFVTLLSRAADDADLPDRLHQFPACYREAGIMPWGWMRVRRFARASHRHACARQRGAATSAVRG